MRYVRANKIETGQTIDPLEDGNWYQVIVNRSVKLEGQRPHREIDARPVGLIDQWKTFSFSSSDEVRVRY